MLARTALLFAFIVSGTTLAKATPSPPRQATEAATGPEQVALLTQAPVDSGPMRAFIASQIDLGYKDVQPRLSVGYGQPFTTWAGMDLQPLLSSTFVGGYAGLRLATPYVSVRSGLSYTYSFARSLLPVEDSYDRHTADRLIDERPGSYGATTTELTLRIPLGPIIALSESEVLGLLGDRRDRYVFVEDWNVVSSFYWAYRQRVGAIAPIERAPGLGVGAVAELVVLPQRGSNVLRLGPIARWRVLPNLGLRFTLLPVVSSPDRLGLAGGEFEVGLRWTWSS